MSEAAEKLWNAVTRQDVDASLKLLQDAGGPCQARDLAKQAHDKGVSWGDGMDYSVVVSGDKETLTVSRWFQHSSIPVAGIVQDRCKR